MTIPADLDDAGRTAFAEAVATLEANGEDPTLYASLVVAYARLRDDVATLRAAWDMDGRPTYSVGSTGQLAVHPMVKGIHDAEKAATDSGAALGITPASRSKMSKRPGVTLGTNTARDRIGIRKAA